MQLISLWVKWCALVFPTFIENPILWQIILPSWVAIWASLGKSDLIWRFPTIISGFCRPSFAIMWLVYDLPFFLLPGCCESCPVSSFLGLFGDLCYDFSSIFLFFFLAVFFFLLLLFVVPFVAHLGELCSQACDLFAINIFIL